MKMPSNFANVEAIKGGFKALPAGGYVCKIINAEVTKSKKGEEMVRICLDILAGEYENYFRKQFDTKRKFNAEAKWSPNANFYVLTGCDNGDEKRQGRFKAFLEAIKESNNDFDYLTFDWSLMEQNLKGKTCGVMFRDEEYAKNDGSIGCSARAHAIYSVSEIDDISIPAKLTLDNSPLPATTGYGQAVSNEDIPF